LQEARATAAKHWTERAWYCHNQRWMRSSKEGAEASRSGGFKNGQEWGKKHVHGVRTSPTGRIESRRNREMVKKQVHTMATTAEKAVSGGDGYISLWTADAKVWVQKNGGVHVVSEGA
jgi:hypothetical protein